MEARRKHHYSFCADENMQLFVRGFFFRSFFNTFFFLYTLNNMPASFLREYLASCLDLEGRQRALVERTLFKNFFSSLPPFLPISTSFRLNFNNKKGQSYRFFWKVEVYRKRPGEKFMLSSSLLKKGGKTFT